MEKFVNVESLGLNKTSVRQLQNLPDSEELIRIELDDNELEAADLKPLSKYPQLVILKLANNKLKSFEDLSFLKDLKSLKNLDLEGNPVAKTSNYRVKMFEEFPSLQVLDSHNRVGELVITDDEDDFGSEGGEDELSENYGNFNINEELADELRMRGISAKEYM